MSALPRTKTDALIGCPQCDAVFSVADIPKGATARCTRCNTRLVAPRRKAGMQIIALSVTIVILVLAAAVFPFLTINAAGTSNSVSILEAALAFSDGILVILALATAAVIVFILLLRVLLALYVLVPVVVDKPPAQGARTAFRWSESLRPWSMAEIFAIGCAVSLVKVTDLADVEFGPAFYMFAALVILVVIQDAVLCRWSVWSSLDKTQG